MTIYLASPFFNEEERAVKDTVKQELLARGHEIIDPQNPAQDSSGWEISNAEWGQKVFNADLEKIAECNAVVAIYWGLYSDSGTACEIGYAMAKEIPVLVVVPDQMLNEKHSLMVANGSNNFVALSRFLKTDTNFLLFSPKKSHFLSGVTQQ